MVMIYILCNKMKYMIKSNNIKNVIIFNNIRYTILKYNNEDLSKYIECDDSSDFDQQRQDNESKEKP